MHIKIARDEMSTIWTDLMQGAFEVKFYDAGGIRTRTVVAGKGEPLIFLHGTGGHLEAFSKNILPHAEHFRVYDIDMVGHGFSDKPDMDYVIPVYANHLLKFMDALGIEKAHLSGESLGGWVAAWFAIEHPQRVNKLVLNTAGGLISNPEVMERIKTTSTAAVMNPTRETVRKRLEFLMADPKSVTDELVEIRYRIYTQPDFPRVMKHILCLQEMEIREKYIFTPEMLRKIVARTLVVWTTHDPTAPSEVGKRFVEYIPDSRFVLMEDCGHWPQFEQADEFNRLHIEFLAA
jgi:2-hydroxy-6-oxonona-2,4-dienedioate hydrolase